MRVLIGYDGSDCSNAAVGDLRRAGLPRDVDAVVISVADVWPHLPPSCFEPLDEAALAPAPPAVRKARALAAEALAEARSLAAEGAGRVRAEFPGWKVGHEAAADSPYRALVLKADRWRPDLLVVGSHGRSAAGRALLGSVSQKVLSHAICSVRVARFREDASRLASDPVRLVLGIDGSPDSAAAARAVADRVWPEGTEVRVVMALDPRILMALIGSGPPGVGLAYAGTSGFGADDHARARHAAEAVAEELRAAGLSAVPAVQAGDPKHVLLQEAERWGADCIFVGAKGHSRLERFLLGSVSSAVAARAHCSVEVVRAG